MNPVKNCDIQQQGLQAVLWTEPDPKLQIVSATKMQQLQPLISSDHHHDDVAVGSSCSASKASVNRFDVFINHRGPDTKETMAIHMYDLLHDRSVEVFLDEEELQVGESLPQMIQEAIDCCKVNVCIFSSGYAESVWCLRELEMIINKYETDEHKSLVIPIFYDVDPADVRHLRGTFGQGFQKHSDRYSSAVIENWRNILFKASHIKGYRGKGKLCRTIVNRICEHLEVGLVAIPEEVVGMKDSLLSIKDDIMRRRKKEEHSVTLVEISGFGGIGKTTFAKCLYNNLHSHFGRSCFIEDVNGLVKRGGGVYAVHRQLIKGLLRYDPIFNENQGQLLKDRLKNADILVFLDNINEENNLSDVFIDYVYLGATSVIAVTSREEGVLKQDRAVVKDREKFLSLLESKHPLKESREIFCYHAFGGIEEVNIIFDVFIDDIINNCDGIPLVLAIMGRHVYGRDIDFWGKFWITIKDSLPPDQREILRFSYERLEKELKKRRLKVLTF